MLQPQEDDYGAGHTDGQPGDVDDGVSFMAQNVSDCYFEVV